MKKISICNFIIFLAFILCFVGCAQGDDFQRNSENIQHDRSLSDTLNLSSKKAIIQSEKEVIVFMACADTPESQVRGLSNVDLLKDDEGLLFLFQKKDRPRFWMKDMKFDLDFLWIDEDTIVDIDENISHVRGKDEIVEPSVAVDKVLEVKAGFVRTHEIEVGDRIFY